MVLGINRDGIFRNSIRRKFHPYYITCKPLLHSSNLLIVERMEVKLGAHVYYIVSMTTTTTNSLRHLSLKLLLHSSNLLTVERMEVKLGAHVL